MKIEIPSPAISIVGRHNSGKTTLIEQLIAEMVARGHDVGSIKHHTHRGFDIDYPGKDSYRHRAAGASETVIAAPDMMARVKTLTEEVECDDLVRSMPGHDIIIVEGYRKSGLPTIEIMRGANDADARVAAAFAEGARLGWQLGTDFTQASREEVASVPNPCDIQPGSKAVAKTAQDENAEKSHRYSADKPIDYQDIKNKLPDASTVAIATDIPAAKEAAAIYGIPAFDINDVTSLADFVEEYYARPRMTMVIQAGGESRRMGQSKALVPFMGRPLICRLIERLSPAADELIITTNEAERLEFLHETYPELDIRLVKDEYEFRGALPGLYTAILNASSPYVGVVACDMVFASAPLALAEAIEMNETGADVVVPYNKHGFEPFHAMYRRETCLPAIKRALDQGNKRAQAFFDDPEIKVEYFTQAQVLEVEPRGGCFVNANTPAELQHLEDSFLED